jgi:hypothetical protein
MAQLPSWIRIVDERATAEGYALDLALARWWWARPSFWIAFLRGNR